MAAISSVGTSFTTGDTVILGTITAISMSGMSAAEIDTTGISSTTKEFVLGTLDGGTVDITVNLVTGSLVSMPTAGDGTPTAFVLKFGTHAAGATVPVFSFSAYIQSSSVEAGVDQQVTANYTLRITGAVTVAASA